MRESLAASFLAVALLSRATAAQSPITSRLQYVTGSCARVLPKECTSKGQAWTPRDKSNINRLVAEIASTALGRRLVDRVLLRLGGRLEFRRFDTCLPPPGQEAQSFAGFYWTGPAPGFLFLCDAFFLRDGVRDRHSGFPGYEFQAALLLHELFHVIDERGKSFSHDPAFFRPSGFEQVGPSRWNIQGETSAERRAYNQTAVRMARLDLARDFAATLEVNRMYARSFRLKSFPTMRAMSGPLEAFAEIGAHLVLDPTAREYLAPAVVRYFDERVFPSLR